MIGASVASGLGLGLGQRLGPGVTGYSTARTGAMRPTNPNPNPNPSPSPEPNPNPDPNPNPNLARAGAMPPSVRGCGRAPHAQSPGQGEGEG